MLIKPIDEPGKDLELQKREEPDDIPGPSPVKMLFLLAIIAFGAFFSVYFHNNTDKVEETITLATEKKERAEPTIALIPREEINKAAQETFQDVSKQSGEIVEEYLAVAQEAGEEVLGQATQSVQDTATESAEKASTEVYKRTVGAIIDQLLAQLPVQAKKEVQLDVCRELTPTPTVETE